MSTTYQIHEYIPYEGVAITYVETIDELKVHLKRHFAQACNFNDIDVYEIVREVDIPELMKEEPGT